MTTARIGTDPQPRHADRSVACQTCLALAVTGLLFLVLGAVALWWIAESRTYHVSQRVTSPDARWRAVLFVVRSGGAAGSCRQVLALEPASDPLPTPARVERIGHEQTAFHCSCGVDVQMTWFDPGELEIAYGFDSEASTYQRSRVGEVRLSYLPRPGSRERTPAR